MLKNQRESFSASELLYQRIRERSWRIREHSITKWTLGSDRKIIFLENVAPNIDGLRIVTRKIRPHSWANVIKPHRSASASTSSAFFALWLIVGR
jgi:hypothetical protein